MAITGITVIGVGTTGIGVGATVTGAGIIAGTATIGATGKIGASARSRLTQMHRQIRALPSLPLATVPNCEAGRSY
jgi:hypothetical protein